MELYWIIHILVFLSVAFEVTSATVKKRVLIVWCVFFTVFGGLRWNTGNDWTQYLEYFRFARWDNVFSYYREGGSLMEPGYIFFIMLVKSIFGEYYWQNLIICGFQQFTYYVFCKKHAPQRPLLTYALFMSAVCYFPIRAGFAVAICMWSYWFIKEKKLICFIAVVLAASSIHNMCLLFLPMYWIGKIKPNFWMYSVAYFAVFFSSVFFANFFEKIALAVMGDLSQVAIYLAYGADGSRVSISNVLLHYLFLCVYIYVKRKEKLEHDDWTSAIINMYFIAFSITMIFLEKYPDLNRMNDIFYAATVLSFVWALEYFLRMKKGVCLFAVLFFIFYYCYKFRNGIGDMFFERTCIPYKSIFEYDLWNLL